MKTLFACVTILTGATIITAGGAGKAPKLDGAWTATAAIIDGNKLPEDEVAKTKLVVTFKDGKYSASMFNKDAGKEKEIEAGTFKIDASKKPATIDLTIGKGSKDAGKTQLGLFKLDGDQLTLVIAGVDVKERPKSFDGEKGVEVTVLKRNK